VDKLILKGPIIEAQRVWGEVVIFLHIPRPNDPAGSLVWMVDSRQISLAVDFHGECLDSVPWFVIVEIQSTPGNVRFKFRFDGKGNVDFHDVCQFVLVSPEVDYELSAWLRTDTLTTNTAFSCDSTHPLMTQLGPPRLRSRVQFLGRASILHGKPPGMYISLKYAGTPSKSEVRQRISGSVWLDDVALVLDSWTAAA